MASMSVDKKMERARTNRGRKAKKEKFDQSIIDTMIQIGVLVTGKKHAILLQKNITARQWCNEHDISEYLVHKITRGEAVSVPVFLKVLKALDIIVNFDCGLSINTNNDTANEQ